ncbi:MAG: APC family permease [Syntrophobacteraceae bacterium]|nr:APC family permease [Syntrophobacteraceae bacterium]
MKLIVLVLLNLSLVWTFVLLLRKPNLISYSQAGKLWLTWLAVGIITLMDEFTSIFYVPAEAHRFIGLSAIVFIALTSILMRFMSTRFTEIAEILEHNGLIGGGVYSFSYLVLGPMISFVAVSSIMVDYTLTACLSAVSAVLNASSFFPHVAQANTLVIVLVLAILWAIAGLNIIGIKENARFTFLVFALAAFVILNLVASGLVELNGAALQNIKQSGIDSLKSLQTGSLLHDYGNFISHLAFCILAYSGIESVIQTAGLVRSWRDSHKAYLFLACTVGLVTPIVAALALSAPLDFAAHEGDLITHYATVLNGTFFGIMVAGLASITLMMAVNTAFVASSELLERVAHRYGFHWLIATNRRNSLYRIHILNATFFSIIVMITSGSQEVLADMYAIGLVASFCINLGSLLIYRYFTGTKEVVPYYTSRLGTLILWIILVGCFIFLAIDKPHGTALWGSVTTFVLVAGWFLAKRRAPEIVQIGQSDNEMEMMLSFAESSTDDIHVIFRRPREEALEEPKENEAYITFFTPRQGIPPKMAKNHYRFPLSRGSLYQRILLLLKLLQYELPEKTITVHFGWPMSSWMDRLAIGVMVFNLMKLPKKFSQFNFQIDYFGRRAVSNG